MFSTKILHFKGWSKIFAGLNKKKSKISLIRPLKTPVRPKIMIETELNSIYVIFINALSINWKQKYILVGVFCFIYSELFFPVPSNRFIFNWIRPISIQDSECQRNCCKLKYFIEHLPLYLNSYKNTKKKCYQHQAQNCTFVEFNAIKI